MRYGEDAGDGHGKAQIADADVFVRFSTVLTATARITPECK